MSESTLELVNILKQENVIFNVLPHKEYWEI